MNPENRVRGYFDHLAGQLIAVLEDQHETMHEVARTWANAIANDNLIYAFGSGHSRFIAGELYWRAGGLAPVMIIDDPAEGVAERVEGYAQTIFDQYEVASGDILVVVSNSGINPVPIEMAMLGKERGATVQAVTSLGHSSTSQSRHSSGKRLFEVADHVLNTSGEYGDAVMPISGRDWKVAPTSTAVSVSILNAIVAQTAELLASGGAEPPVLVSANVPEGDQHNERLAGRYGKRLAKFPRRVK